MDYYEMYYDYVNDTYSDSFEKGILNTDLLNNKNELVLMYGTSIIIIDINTLKVINYVTSKSINRYGIKLIYDNNKYIVEDDFHELTYFDNNLNEIK